MARTFTAGLNPNLYKILYLHWTCGSALDLLRQLALLELDLVPALYTTGATWCARCSEAIVRLNQEQEAARPILISCDEAPTAATCGPGATPAIAELRYGFFALPGLLAFCSANPRCAALCRCRCTNPCASASPCSIHLEGLSGEELDAYLTHQLKAALGVSQTLFDDTARQALYQATKGIPRKVNKLAMASLRVAAARKAAVVNEAILLDATTEALL